ncbi:MAG: CpaF family protein [Pseudomonadota bacterium]
MKGGNFGKTRAPHLRPAAGFGKPGFGTPVSKSEAARQQWEGDLESFVDELEASIETLLPESETAGKTRAELAFLIDEKILELSAERNIVLPESERRDVVTVLLNSFIDLKGDAVTADPLSLEDQAKKNLETASKNSVTEAKDRVQPQLFEHIDPSAAMEMERADLAAEVSDLVGELLADERLSLNSQEQRDVVTLLLNDMLGLGPLEPLLADPDVTDIMVNGKNQTYIEKHGKLTLSDVQFRDEQHLLNIATRIVSAVGRRVDETQPICDARLEDGSRVNVIIPPLAIDGTSISIRKFSQQKITLDKMVGTENVSPQMCQVLKIAGRCRLNILISGGTGSGKTTMLNAISQMIDEGERVVTIEDAAELQLQQPHVVRLETRPANLEGQGEITMRDLVKNALRMRPDRIILGEIRGGEAIDMLQAMNTGHDGSLGTVHANRPREALTRMENMVNMAGMHLPSKAIRTQIADAVNMIVQVARMRDGKRRVCYVTEVVGMEGEVITTQDLFTYKFTGEDADGNLTGEFISTGVRPAFYERAEYFGLGRSLMEAMG